MGKLGGKARKFAKKNLQSLLKRKRKLKSVFKKTYKKRTGADEDTEGNVPNSHPLNGRIIDADVTEDVNFDHLYSESNSESDDDDSGSDGYLSDATTDDSAKTDGEICVNCTANEKNADIELSEENKDILLQLKKNESILKRLKANDPKFSKLLQRNKKHAKALQEQSIYEDETITQSADEKDVKKKCFLRERTIDSLCEFLRENYDASAFLKLVNAYRTVCHFGDEPNYDASSQALTKVVIFMLNEANNIFRRRLGTEAISDSKKNSKWASLRPLLKSYLRSTLHLLQQVTEPEMITFTVVKLRPSIIYFASCPYLLKRLVKISSHLWVTCQGDASQQSFLLIQDIATLSNSKWFDLCLSAAYKNYTDHCQSDDPSLLNHMQDVRSSLVNLCSSNIVKAYSKAFKSVRVLRNGVLQAMKSKSKEAVRRVSSWQYINCTDLWVAFVSSYTSEYDLQLLLEMLVEVITSMAILFPGPRYLPLRINCIKWLNTISSSSGVFIPVVSLILTILDYKVVKGGKKPPQKGSLSYSIKLPKSWVKSKEFQEACISSVLHLLAMHFLRWSFHIAFPELATFPVIRLKSFMDSTSLETSKRVTKRFVEQVEQNVDFVLKKREEVAFSPNDQPAADSFLHLHKSISNASFIQYYRSLLETASPIKIN